MAAKRETKQSSQVKEEKAKSAHAVKASKANKSSKTKSSSDLKTKAEVKSSPKAANKAAAKSSKSDLKKAAPAKKEVSAKKTAAAKKAAAPAKKVAVKKSSVVKADTHSASPLNLKDLRAQIDKLDDEIAHRLQERLALVRSAAQLKSNSGEGAVSALREQHILEHGADLESKYELPVSLMQDLQRRILRESYIEKGSGSYAHASFKPSAEHKKLFGKDDAICRVCIVGGAGSMGRFFVRYLKAAAYEVSIVDINDYGVDENGNAVDDIHQSCAAKRLGQADWTIVCVPIDHTIRVIKLISPLLRKDCVLSDLTSIKDEPIKAMLEAHEGPVIGLHPMFGPDTVSFIKQVVVAVAARESKKTAFIIEQLKLFGANVVECSSEEHDNAMRVIQALRHFTTIAYGNFLRERFGDIKVSSKKHKATKVSKSSKTESETCDLKAMGVSEHTSFVARLLELSSPIYHLELLMVGRLFAQDPALYTDIISASTKNLELIGQYVDCAARCLDKLKGNERESYIADFNKTTEFFGDFAKQFLKESGHILALVQDTVKAQDQA